MKSLIKGGEEARKIPIRSSHVLDTPRQGKIIIAIVNLLK